MRAVEGPETWKLESLDRVQGSYKYIYQISYVWRINLKCSQSEVCPSLPLNTARKQRLIFRIMRMKDHDRRTALRTRITIGAYEYWVHRNFVSITLRDWDVRPMRAGCCSWVALSSTDSKIRYRVRGNGVAGLVNLGRDSQIKKTYWKTSWKISWYGFLITEKRVHF